MFTCLTIALVQVSGCSPDSSTIAPTAYVPQNAADESSAVTSADKVDDLQLIATTGSSITLSWTEVDGGRGSPAYYRVKYATPPIDWKSAEIGCDRTISGVTVGATMSCRVEGLAAGTDYELQLMSYRLATGSWRGAVYSNIAAGSTLEVMADPVTDLGVASATTSSLTIRWTEVDDGTGSPASYRVKYDTPAINYAEASIGCDRTIVGVTIGAEMSCTITDLPEGTTYDVQLRSFRTVDGAWQGAVASNVVQGSTVSPTASQSSSAVTDLAVASATASTLTVRWTEVDDGTGNPAWYRVKYAAAPISYGSATIGCDRTIVGVAIGAEMSCTIADLPEGTTYDVQLKSYRTVDGIWQDARDSNVAEGTTLAAVSQPPALSSLGIWADAAELAALPMSGIAWDNLLKGATGSCGTVNLADQDQLNNVCILAKSLVFARTGTPTYRTEVLGAIRQIADGATYVGNALSLGRELAAYVVAADLIALPTHDPDLDQDFRRKLRELLTTYTSGAATNLVDCQERRPNNWGTHCGASRVAVAIYLEDMAELDRAAQVFRGYLGERSAYAGFKYGADLSWQCDPVRPVGINPRGCQRYGQDLGGILPDDQRRGGSYAWPPVRENYVWEALQGAVVQAALLDRAGYPAFEWGDQALLRAAQWLHTQASYPAEGDDVWQPHLLNYYYGTSFPAPVPTRAGKNFGWTDWTHGR